MLLAHAAGVALYRSEFQDKGYTPDGAKIGITLNVDWGEPTADVVLFGLPAVASKANEAAAERYMEFQLGWFAVRL